MPQLHFSVDEETVRALRERAKAKGQTVSSYLAGLIVDALGSEWPKGYLGRVIGSCSDEPLEEPEDLELREIDL